MAKEGLISLIDNAEGDNAGVWRWLSRMANALLCHSAVGKSVESPVAGAINRCAWQPAYFSGYQLASPCGELLVEWLESCKT